MLLISEILNVHSDNRIIEFNCKKCGVNEILIDQYLDILSKINFHKKCSSCENNIINKKYFYCFNCKKDYCESCKNNYHFNKHSFIEVGKKEIVYKEFEYFCLDCYQNFGEIERYKDHKIIEISDSDQSFIENQEKIKEINEELKNPEEFIETKKNYDNEIINNLNKELLCCKCGEIPEILNVRTYNNKIELKCKNCGIYEILIDNYYSELSNNNYFRNCKICNFSDNNLYYCYECGFNLCEVCKNSESHKMHKFIIRLDKKEDFCPKHFTQFKYFCNDCHENFCEKEKENGHKNHEIIEINPKDKSCEEYIKNLEIINKKIKKIIEFNKLVLNIGKRFKNNYFHLKNIINLGESIKEENKRNSKDFKYLLSGLVKDIDNSYKVFDYFLDKKQIQLHRNDKYIYLNEKELDDKDFKYISRIRFNQLIEIDISENNITNVEPLKKMNLPFLEFLNLGHNKIKKIEPIAKLKSKNLQYIFLQNNQIEDIETFLESEFPSLKILRVEDNNIIKENEQDENIIKKIRLIDKKYPGKFVYISIKNQIIEFKKKYGMEISKKDNIIENLGENEREEFYLGYTDDNNMIKLEFEGYIKNIVSIDLCDLHGGDEMLKYLFLIITYKSKNGVKELVLRNNNLRDLSILSRINFNQLETLDLAVNEITNIKFLSDMKAKHLKYLYLDYNNLSSIYPLFNTNFPNLEVLSLNDNNFNDDNMEETLEYKDLKEKENKYNYMLIQFDDSDLCLRNKICYYCYYCGKNFEYNKDMLLYCYDCGREFCRKCEVKHREKNNGHTKLIKISEKENRYSEGYNGEKCVKKFVDSDQHKSHKKIKLEKYNKQYLENIEIIKEKNKKLLNIINFNETIMNCFKKQKNNYLYLINLKNIFRAFQREKLRDSNDLKLVLNDFDNEIKNSEKAIIKIFNEKDIKIERQEENLLLSNKQINDENIKLISLIKFNNLKEINLSENEITNIEPLCNINLPYLELLNLSYNKIINIEPLGEINSRKLQYLFIQNNQIEDFEVFFDNDFRSLSILRLEENKIKEDSDTFKKLEKKYKNIVISDSYFKRLKSKYKIIYNEKDDKNEKKIQIINTNEGDSILKDLFIIISHKNKNRITKLNLKNNKIVDPSLLKRIQFDSLEELDLSGNNIKNLDFLKGMKAKKLKYLYLDNNYINDLSPLKNYNYKNVFEDLTIILKKNNFDVKDPKISNTKDYKNKVIKLKF